MSNQIVISSGAKVRNLSGVLTGTSGIVSSVPLGAANGVATLDSLGKVPLSQLPASVVTYLGTWNASTNTPTLANGTGDTGDLYICNVAGTVNFGAGPITFAVGDWVIYSGTTWERSAGASGTVTSVAVTESGDALSITGSPITTSGTINIGFAGTSGQYINGAGGLTTFPDLTGYVPYTGATAEVDLGFNNLSASHIVLDGYSYGDGGALNFKQFSSISVLGDGYTSIGASGNNLLSFNYSQGGFNSKSFKFDVTNITTSTSRTYLMPNANGTLALTSDLGAYLPLAGGTLTGGLIGTTGSFASSGGSDTFAINHSSGSGIALNITKGGSGEGLYINKTSGSGNAATIIGTLNATTLVKSGGTSSQYLMADGSVSTLTNPITGTGTTNTLPKFTAASTIGNSNITDTGSLITLGSNTTISSGGLGIGTTSLTSYSLRIGKAITGGTTARGLSSDGAIQSDVTANAVGLGSQLSTAAASFTLLNLYQFYSGQGTIGAGSTVTNQYGYHADSTLIGATNNYGFRGAIPSGTNRWNLYMDGTADNYLSGSLLIGNTLAVSSNLRVSKTITGATTWYGVRSDGRVLSDVTSKVENYTSFSSTLAASFTLGTYSHYSAQQGTIGAGSTITNQIGYEVQSSLIGATNNYGFYGNLAAATNRWNLYMNGTANNYMAGKLLIGSTTDSGEQLQVTGTAKITGAVTLGGQLSISSAFGTSTSAISIYNSTGASASNIAQLDFRLNNSFGGNERVASITALNPNAAANNGGALVFSVSANGTGTTPTEDMRITSSGNVGIGTSSPSARLDIISNGSANALVLRTRDGDDYTFVNFRNNSGSELLSEIYLQRTAANTAYLAFTTNNGSSLPSERMRITSGGNVLIGTTTATSDLLTVNGSIRSGGTSSGLFTQNRVSSNIFGFYASTNFIVYNSDIGTIGTFAYNTGTYTPVSDINRKKDFEASTIGLNAILGLKPTLYRMKGEDENTEKQLGFIAQEVKEFIPQAYVESDDFIGLSDRPIIAALVKAMQEQQAQIEELKALINK